MMLVCSRAISQGSYQLAVLKYNGGGDYYANPTALPNLISFCNKQLGTNISKETPYVDVGSKDLFLYPFLHMTGHGNVVFSASPTFTGTITAELSLVELPSNHPVFNQKFKLKGLPKIHEHDGKRPQAFGLLYQGRLVCLYTYETDLSDGWEDPQVHNDPTEKHIEALQMGANLIQYVYTQ